MNNQAIQIGDRVPDFLLKNQHGEEVSVKQFFGKPFVIFFYPKDNTPGCTKEACGFRDAYAELRNLDAEVIGISADSPASHRKFAEDHNLPFTLLSDTNNKVRKLFGVKGSLFGLLPGRVTYIMDEKGHVQHIFDSQWQAQQHVQEVLGHLKKQPSPASGPRH